MRLWEFTGAAADVWRQNQRTTDALRKLRAKQQDAADAKAAAKSLAAGPERNRRVRAADRKDANAKRVFANTQRAARDAIAKTLSHDR